MQIKYFVKSLTWFLKSLTGQKKIYDVVFYYPHHFNRSLSGSNPFFDPLIETCKLEGLSYLVFEEPDSTAKSPRNNKSIPADSLLYLILILRKLIPSSSYPNLEEREWRIARIIKPIFFRKISFTNFITISNSMLGIFRGLNPNATLFDVQHGILYSWHWGYILQGLPTEHIKLNNTRLFISGEGFRKLLIKGNIDYYNEHVTIIGDPNFISITKKNNNRKVLVSLTATSANESSHEQTEFINFLKTFFLKFSDFFAKYGYEFIIKSHPRYDGYLSMDWINEYNFVKPCETNLEEALATCSIHLTNFSTTAFDAAGYGLPTIFFKSDLSIKLFKDEFGYPDYEINTNTIECFKAFTDILSYQEASSKATNWYKTYYQPFNSRNFLNALRQKN